MQLYSLLCWAFGSGTDTTCVNSLVSGSLYSNPTFCMQGEKFATESTLLWKWFNFRRFSHFIEKVNKKRLVVLSKKDLAEIAFYWTIYHYGRILISRESFQKYCMDQWYVQQLSIQKTIKKNYITPVGVSDRPKSKFWSLESYVSHFNSALSWNFKIKYFLFTMSYISFDQSLFHAHMREEQKWIFEVENFLICSNKLIC